MIGLDESYNHMNPQRLYIIGNGFDIHHGLNTRYQSFGLFLKQHHNELYEELVKYFWLSDLDGENPNVLRDPLWSDFEVNLANLNYEQVFEDKADYVGSAVSDPKEFHAFQFEMEMVVERLTINLRAAFKSFIEQVTFPKLDSRRLSILKDSLFLNFNYTQILEHYYTIPSNRILYIHNKAFGTEELVLGHGIDPDQFIIEEEKPPENATEEELDRWNEHMADQYNPTFENGRHSLWSYFSKSNKTTDSIILNKNDFFKRLGGIKEVYVLGHSLAEVDHPYFKKIIESTENKSAKWLVSYHSQDDSINHPVRLQSLGLEKDRINMIRMKELLVKSIAD